MPAAAKKKTVPSWFPAALEAMRARIAGPEGSSTESARDAFIREVALKFKVMGMTPAQQDEFVALLNDNHARIRV